MSGPYGLALWMDPDRGPLYRKNFGLLTSLPSRSIIPNALGLGDHGLAMSLHIDKCLRCKPLAHTTGDQEGSFSLSRTRVILFGDQCKEGG